MVCPHPDDEALATGGLLARQARLGASVLVVAVTDGEAAFSSTPDPALAAIRRAEQAEALGRLGLEPVQMVRLGLPDGSVARHERDLVGCLGALVTKGDLVVGPSPQDWHPDHEACGRATAVVARALGCRVLGSLFWAHSHPERLAASAKLVRLPLSDDERRLRRHAVLAHVSQLRPDAAVVGAESMRHLERSAEYYVSDLLCGSNG